MLALFSNMAFDGCLYHKSFKVIHVRRNHTLFDEGGAPEEEEADTKTTTIAAHERKQPSKPKRVAIPEHFERERIEVDITDEIGKEDWKDIERLCWADKELEDSMNADLRENVG